jgi:hypothetical protein
MTCMGRAYQEISFTGDYGDDGFIELYTCLIRGEPTRVVAATRLMGERFAGTQLGTHFITPADEPGPAARAEEESL